MLSQKYRWMLPFCVSLLVVMACGQVSFGVITPTAADAPGEMPVSKISDPTAASIDSEPDSTPDPELDAAATPDSTAYPIPTMAYVGSDHNLWVLEAGSQTARQITFDANRNGGDSSEVVYSSPLLSSDSTLLAYYKDVRTPSASGYDITHEVWVLNLVTGEQRQILDSRFSGMAWKPGTHLLAYGHEVDMDYANFRDDPGTDQLKGIHTIDLDNDETDFLVTPERGYALSGPNWSPDGRFLAFSESVSMETGMFAYYDLENQEYVAWDESIGRASWSPDGSLLAYDRVYYVYTEEERLYLRPRQGDEQLLGPDYEGPAFASQPYFSPAGDQIAYLAHLEGPMTDFATIMLLDLSSGEAQPLGKFEDVWELAWTPDGSHLVFSFGIYPARQIVALNLSDGSQTVLADGDNLTLGGQ